MLTQRTLQTWIVLVSFVWAAACPAQNLDLSWSTIDCGGTTFSTVFPFKLGGTIGQPDAQVVAAGNLVLVGGFWSAMQFSPPPPPPAPGDCDQDGDVDLADHDNLAACLNGPGGGLGLGCECSDFDADHDVDLRDFASFHAAFTGDPEP